MIYARKNLHDFCPKNIFAPNFGGSAPCPPSPTPMTQRLLQSAADKNVHSQNVSPLNFVALGSCV